MDVVIVFDKVDRITTSCVCGSETQLNVRCEECTTVAKFVLRVRGVEEVTLGEVTDGKLFVKQTIKGD